MTHLDDLHPERGDVEGVALDGAATGYPAVPPSSMSDEQLDHAAAERIMGWTYDYVRGYGEDWRHADGEIGRTVRSRYDAKHDEDDWSPVARREDAQQILDAMNARKLMSAVAEEIMRARTGHHGIGHAKRGTLCRHMLLATPREITIACLRALDVAP